MSDRIIYLVSKVTEKIRKAAAVEWVDNEGFSTLMSQGYEQVSTMERKIGGVKATMIVLRPSGENRGLAASGGGETHSSMVSFQDDYGQQQRLPAMAALTQLHRELAAALNGVGAAGHLGAPGRHTNLEGVTIISGEIVGKALDMGQIAARLGKPVGSCPFPAGSAPHTQWMRGYRSRERVPEVTDSAREEAYRQGMSQAMSLGREDVAHCPYPVGSPLREDWLLGFKQGGGRVV